MTAFTYAACSCGIAVTSSTIETGATVTSVCQRCCGSVRHLIVYESRQEGPLDEAIEDLEKAAKKPRQRPPKSFQERREWWNK